MRSRRPPPDSLTLVVAALVSWGVLNAASVYGLPWWLAVPAALAAFTGLLASHRWVRTSQQDLAHEGDVGPEVAHAILGITIAAAAVLRASALLRKPTWADEMWTLRNIYTADWAELLRVAFDDYWPPVYYLILNAMTRVADTGLVWLRLPSVVFGIATVALMYPLGRRLFGSRTEALVSAALLAGMTSHVLYSQEARVYSLHVFLAVASALTFYTSYWERRISVGFLVSTTLLTYTHSFASWYFIAAQGVYVVVGWILWRDATALKKGVQSQSLVLLLWVPLAGAFLYSRVARSVVVPTQWATAPDDPPWVAGLIEQYQGLAVRSWVGAALLVLLIGLALYRLGAVRRERGISPTAADDEASPPAHERAVVFLLCWCLVPVLFSLAVTAATSLDTFIEIRYHLAVLPGICLLAAGGYGAIRSGAARVGVVSLLILVPGADLHRYYTDFNRPAIDHAADIVRTMGQPDQPVYVYGGFRAFAYYYRGITPRIGSARWDSLSASTASLGDQYTLHSVKWGDTYAFEKLPPNVRSFVYFSPPPSARLVEFVEWETNRGGLSGSFWVVQEDPPPEGKDLLLILGDRCHDRRTWSVRDLTVAYCNPPEPTALSGPLTQPSG